MFVVVVEIVVVVVDLHSASRNAYNALIVPLRHKKMSFQRQPEAVGTPSRVQECGQYKVHNTLELMTWLVTKPWHSPEPKTRPRLGTA